MTKKKTFLYRVGILRVETKKLDFNNVYHAIDHVINKYKRKFGKRVYGGFKIVTETRDWETTTGFLIRFRVRI